MAASNLSLFSPIRKKIVLPISEAFARILFEGREHTKDIPEDGTRRLLYKGHVELLDSYRNIAALGWHMDNNVIWNMIDIYERSKHEINKEKSRIEPSDDSTINLLDDDISTIIINTRRWGSKTQDPVYEFYGEWDDSGPRLVFKRLVGRGIFNQTMKTMNRFIERLKNIDEWVSGQPDITVRMAAAAPVIQEANTIFDPLRPVGTAVPAHRAPISPNLRNAGEGRPALPEEVIRGPLMSMLQNQRPAASRNLAAPLSRLVKKGGRRGRLSAKRVTRKAKSRGRAHSRKQNTRRY